jgi:hypothetical protein
MGTGKKSKETRSRILARHAEAAKGVVYYNEYKDYVDLT